MIPPEHFHVCLTCRRFSIDPDNTYPGSDKPSKRSDIFFFDVSLKDVLNGLTEGCELCLWLDSLWGGDSSSSRELYANLKAGKNTSKIVVCADTYSMSLVDRYPVDEIGFFGLWEEDAVLHSDWGKCRVFAKCSVDIFTTQDDAASNLILNRPINCFPGSAESLQLCRKWYEDCQASHTKCRAKQTYMPLRVLNIMGDYNSCDFHVTLKTIAPNEPIEPFAALSYCWGGDQPYKTTKARMQSDQITLEWHKCPKSIQDAIQVTSALGLRYLWADSLCIIQDDDEDKIVQIADMTRIYNQAAVTIIGSRSGRAIDGFLGEINLKSQTRLAVRLPFRCSGQERTYGSAYLTQIDGTRDMSEPIETRAWTLQERYLSKRIVEFGSIQTRWTCTTSSLVASTATTKCSDAYADGWKWDRNSGDRPSEMMYLHTDLLAELVELAQNRSSVGWVREWLDGRWETVLGEYTPRLLSVPTDRILGIAGVAEIYLSHFHHEGQNKTEEYLAGMWRSSLPQMLCWHVEFAKGPAEGSGASTRLSRAPGVYQGPSWSWAAVNRGVSFILGRACNRGGRATLLNAEINLVDARVKCGSVTQAILTLKGRTRRAVWNRGEGTLHVDINGNAQDSTETAIRKTPLAHVYPDTCDIVDESSTDRGAQFPVWLFEIGDCTGLGRRGPVGLILEPTNIPRNNDPPRFRRLGLFHINTKKPRGNHSLPHVTPGDLQPEDHVNFFKDQTAITIQLE